MYASASRLLGLVALVAATTPVAEAGNWRSTSGLVDRTTFQTLMSSLDSADTPIDAWAVDDAGEWIVVADGTVSNSAGFNSTIVKAAKLNLVFGRDIWGVDCNAAGACVLIHSKGYQGSGTLPTGLGTKINSLISGGSTIRDVEITNSGYLMLYNSNSATYSGIDSDLAKAVSDRVRSDRVVTDVSIGIDGRWMLLADQNPMYEDLSSGASSALITATEAEQVVDKLLLGNGSTYVLYNGDDDTVTADLTDPIQAVEFDLQRAGSTFNLWERMDTYGVPGLSIAIVEGNEVIAARGYGLLDEDDDAPVLGNTPFDLASLSKFPSGLTALSTLEALNSDGDTTNDLDLDDDLLDATVLAGHIDNWKVEGEAGLIAGFPAGLPDMPEGITMRRLLSHTASMRSKGSTPVLATYADTSHTTLDWLEGLTCEFGPCEFDTEYAWVDGSLAAPGSGWTYSNSGFLVAQAMLEDYTGQTGAELVTDTLLSPLGLTDSSVAYPDYDGILSRTAVQHDTLSGAQDRMLYPWTFAGGYVSSPADYAEILILALNEGKSSSGSTVLSSAVVSDALSVQTGSEGTNYGTGVSLPSGSVTERNGRSFWHNGAHPGHTRTWMCGVPGEDRAIVIAINIDDPSSVATSTLNPLFVEIISAYERSVGWSGSGCGV